MTEGSGADGDGRRPPVLPEGKPETIAAAVRVLRSGGVIAVPTDTVFGLVARYDDETAVERIFTLKGRRATKALPVLLGTATELRLVATDVHEAVWPLIYRYWPGALTVILRAHQSLSRRVTGGSDTVGVRVPAHAAVLEVLEALSLPLASTSANLSGRPPARTVPEVVEALGSSVDLVIAPAQSPVDGRPSAVVDLTAKPYIIRRRGEIPPSGIRQALGARIEIAEGA